MPDPLPFQNATNRFALPLLHVGQAQKEVFVNEALARTDALLHCTVVAETTAPPVDPAEGKAWLIGTGATDAWAGHEGEIALHTGGGWAFIGPRDGMRVFDLAAGREMLFFTSWRKASLPVEPLGGTSVDGEARAAINDLVSALQALGILPSA
jgi:hypothetical protein